MRINHKIQDSSLEAESTEAIGAIITNKSGGFFCIGPKSRYSGGFFCLGGRVLKIVEDIGSEGQFHTITNNFWSIELAKETTSERYFMPLYSNTLIYEASDYAAVKIILDVREPYDNREWGRNYSITEQSNRIIVKFTKNHDPRDTEHDEEEEYTVFIAITGDEDLHYKKTMSWLKREYDFDRERGSQKHERYVYDCARIVSKRIIISVGESAEEAIAHAEAVSSHLEKLKDTLKKYHWISQSNVGDKNIDFAYKCAVNSLDSMLIKDRERLMFYAGLPWFFQSWTRDEAISLLALMQEQEYDACRRILLRQIQGILPDGRLENRWPSTQTGSADGIGWHFKRWDDLIGTLSSRKILKDYFDKQQITEISNKLMGAVKALTENHLEDGFLTSGDKESWMDSIGRSGTRIEMQALMLCIYRLMHKASGSYSDHEEKLREQVRNRFWNGSYLKDGIDDDTIRPNIFIAAYLYPELLNGQEWEKCFDTVLPHLWLNWGGLSTIDLESKDFVPEYSGENPTSYHNGDSWFYLNNMAAIVLHRTNNDKYRQYIEKIVEASTRDILWNGIVGHHAELSSAAAQKSQGCLAQTWSSALYIELVNEIYQ